MKRWQEGGPGTSGSLAVTLASYWEIETGKSRGRKKKARPAARLNLAGRISQMNSLIKFSKNSWRPLLFGAASPFLSI